MKMSTRLNGIASRITMMALCAAAASAGAVARPPSGYQQMVGEGTLLYEQGWGVIELSGGDLLGMGETFDFTSGIYESKQSVTRFAQDGVPLWSFLFDWGAQTDKALEAVGFDGDLVVSGSSFRNSTFRPGADFSNRLTLMRLDQAGAVVWANRYPGGALPPGNTFTWSDLEGQVAMSVAPALTPSRGVPVAMELVTASFHKESIGDSVEGQFMRVNGSGAITALVRYSAPAGMATPNLPFFAIAHDPASGSFVMGGYLPYYDEPSDTYVSDPTVIRVDGAGGVQQAWHLPLQPPEPGANPAFTSPVTTSLVMAPDGEVFAAGAFRYSVSGQGRSNTWIARMNPTTGQIAWIRQLTFLAPGERSLSLNAQGELCVVGEYSVPGPLDPDVYEGPVLAVVDSGSGALIRARAFRPSAFGNLRDGVALTSGGWQFIGSGVVSGLQSAGSAQGGRGGGDGGDVDLYLVRTDAMGAVGCHDGEIEIVTYDLGLQQAVGFQPIVTMSDDDELAQALTPQAVVMDSENDCLFVRCHCFSDADGDEFTDFNDISATIASWQANYGVGETGPGDANCDSVVDFNDINTEIALWLNDCNPKGP